MSNGSEKSHVLTTDVITIDAGRCEAGMMIDEGDVIPSTWQWLLDRNFIRSVESIEAEADADDEQDTEDSTEQPTEEQVTDTQPESEVVESTVVTEQVATDAQPASEMVETPTVVTEEPKPTGRRTRKQ